MEQIKIKIEKGFFQDAADAVTPFRAVLVVDGGYSSHTGFWVEMKPVFDGPNHGHTPKDFYHLAPGIFGQVGDVVLYEKLLKDYKFHEIVYLTKTQAV